MSTPKNLFTILGKLSETYSDEEISDHLLTIKKQIDNIESNVFQSIELVFDVPKEFFIDRNFDKSEIDKTKRKFINICFINLFLNNIRDRKQFCLHYNFNKATFEGYLYRDLKNIRKNKKFDKNLNYYITQTELKFKELTIKNL